jgi:PAS domain S-box-containing protein
VLFLGEGSGRGNNKGELFSSNITVLNAVLRGVGRVPLRYLLVLAFVTEIVGVVGIVGWLSYRNSQSAVSTLVDQLQQKTAQRIEQQLQGYLTLSQALNQVHAASVASGKLDPDNFVDLQSYFWQQLKAQHQSNYFIYSNRNGNSLGLERQDSSHFILKLRDRTTQGDRVAYQLDPQGRRRSSVLERRPFDPRTRPFYRAALAAGKPTWSPIYVSFSRKVLRMDAVTPIYTRTGELRGVFSTEVTLQQINAFLNHLQISRYGQAFIMERSGAIVASSLPESPFLKTPSGEKRLLAMQSRDPVIQTASQAILRQFNTFEGIQTPTRLRYEQEGKPHLVSINPFRDALGLDWLVVIVVPEADFMQPLEANNQVTLGLSLAALGLAIVTGVMMAHWVVHPILKLNRAAQSLAQGEWNQRAAIARKDEVGELAQAFNQMAEQLQASFTALEQANQALEQRVAERTASLADSEAINRNLLNAVPDILARVNREGVYVDFKLSNQFASAVPLHEIIGKNCLDVLPPEIAQQRMAAVQRALDTGEVQFHEYELEVGGELHYEESRIIAVGNGEALIMIRDISERVRLERQRQQAEAALRQEKERSEQLLLNILPQAIAERLKHDSTVIAESFEEVSILFADLVSFTALSARMQPIELVNLLNQIFSAFDHLAEQLHLEKIKTSGDAYMVAAGLPTPRPDHAEAIAQMALAMQEVMHQIRQQRGEPLHLRIGIHSGVVVAGVIGKKKFIYDLWGDTVNTASRMESHGEPDQIQVTEATYYRLKQTYALVPRGPISIKGKGDMNTYWLVGKPS